MIQKLTKEELFDLNARFDIEFGFGTFWNEGFANLVLKNTDNFDYKANDLSILDSKIYKGYKPEKIYSVSPKDYFDVVYDDEEMTETGSILDEVLNHFITCHNTFIKKEDLIARFDEVLILDPFEIKESINKQTDDFVERAILFGNYKNMFEYAGFIINSQLPIMPGNLEPNLGDRIVVKFNKENTNDFEIVVNPGKFEKSNIRPSIVSGKDADGSILDFNAVFIYEDDNFTYLKMPLNQYELLLYLQYMEDVNLNNW